MISLRTSFHCRQLVVKIRQVEDLVVKYSCTVSAISIGFIFKWSWRSGADRQPKSSLYPCDFNYPIGWWCLVLQPIRCVVSLQNPGVPGYRTTNRCQWNDYCITKFLYDKCQGVALCCHKKLIHDHNGKIWLLFVNSKIASPLPHERPQLWFLTRSVANIWSSIESICNYIIYHFSRACVTILTSHIAFVASSLVHKPSVWDTVSTYEDHRF